MSAVQAQHRRRFFECDPAAGGRVPVESVGATVGSGNQSDRGASRWPGTGTATVLKAAPSTTGTGLGLGLERRQDLEGFRDVSVLMEMGGLGFKYLR